MRKRYSDSGADEAAIDLTPMLDIVFIMLIFFIVTSSFIRESGVEVQRPQADHLGQGQACCRLGHMGCRAPALPQWRTRQVAR